MEFQILAALTCVLLLGCGQPFAMEPKHDLNRPVRSAYAFQWYKVDTKSDVALLKRAIAKFQKKNQLVTLPNHVPLSRELQGWVDKIDETLRHEHGSSLQNVPPPRVLIVADESANAGVYPVPVCLPVGMKRRTGRGKITRGLVSMEGLVDRYRGECLQAPTSFDGKAFVQWFNSQTVACRLQWKDGYISAEGCVAARKVGDFAQAEQLVFFVTPNWIVLHSGLLKQFSQFQVVSVLAHELGHYYRSHLTAAMEGKDYNFFYRLPHDPSNLGYKPRIDPELQKEGNRLRQLTLPTRFVRRIAGQRFVSELFRPLMILINHLYTVEGKCKELAQWLESAAVKSSFGDFPKQKLDSDGLRNYWLFESQVESCLQNEEVGGAIHTIDNEVMASALSFDHMVYQIYFRHFTVAEGPVLTTLHRLAGDLKAAIAVRQAPLKDAWQQGLGFYTAEQEADELSLEWLVDLKVDPEMPILTELQYTALHESAERNRGIAPYPFAVPLTPCKALFENRWRYEDGTFALVPVADFTGLHHSSCFRAYNLWREIGAHNYRVKEPLQEDPWVWREQIADIPNISWEATKLSTSLFEARALSLQSLLPCPFQHAGTP